MSLSNDLISQFVKITNDKKESKTETTAYGTTVEQNGKIYVRLDGSELLTPVTATTNTKTGERVMVLLKNHTATITGNISSPSARLLDIADQADAITELEIVIAAKADVEELNAANARIDTLVSEDVLIKNKLIAAEGNIESLQASSLEIKDDLTAAEASITKLQTEKLDANAADIKYATITDLNATNTKVYNLESTYGDFASLTADRLDAIDVVITNLDSNYASITDLDTERARIDVLEAGSLGADSAIIKQLQSDIADIDTLIFGSSSGTTIQTSFANAVIAQLGNAQIKSAMIESISADKITSGDIITNNVRVMSEDGSLIISDETMQISDSTRVRVQIGKDSTGDYSINIWDANGNLMFSEGGITDNAIKSSIIRDDMVSDTANISAHKLNIESLFEEINNSSSTIKSSKIFMDSESQTLDVVFTDITSQIGTLEENVETQGTQLSVIQGQISSKVWQQDIDTVNDTLTTKYSSLSQSVADIDAIVANHTTEIAQKADESTVTTVIDQVSSLEVDLTGFKTTVSDTYATKTELTTQITSVETSVTQNTDSIQSIAARTTENENAISTLEQTATGLTSRVSTVESNADIALTNATDAQEMANTNAEHIEEADSIIQQLSDSISMLIVDESGESLMTQNGDRWVFSMAQYNETLNSVSSELDDLLQNVGDTQNTVDVLNQAVSDLGVLADYIVITTYNDQPCIELGEIENNFKLRITNTEIQFVEGTTIPAYLSNQKLYIEKAEVTGELQQGGFVWKARSNGNLGLIWKGVSE